MDYYINPTYFSAVFTIPTSVVDRYLKLAKPEHIMVIIYILRNMSTELSEKEISGFTGQTPVFCCLKKKIRLKKKLENPKNAYFAA